MAKHAPVRIDFRELGGEFADQWADVKPRRSLSDRLAIRHAAMYQRPDGTFVWDTPTGQLTALDRAIVAWSYGDLPACRCDEVKRGTASTCPRQEAIGEVDEVAGEYLYDRLQAMYAGEERSEDSKSGPAGRPAGGEAGRDAGDS